MPTMTELMNAFTLASLVFVTTVTALPPRGEPPRLRSAVQMPRAGASERQVHARGEPQRHLLDALLVRPLRYVLDEKHPRLDGSRRTEDTCSSRLVPACTELAEDRPSRVRDRDDDAERTGHLVSFHHLLLKVERSPCPTDRSLQEEHAPPRLRTEVPLTATLDAEE